MRKRIICFSVVIILVLSSLSGRIGYIVFSNSYSASDTHSSYLLTLEKQYPTLYYSNKKRITNNAVKYFAVLKPNTRTLTDLHNLFSANEIKSITNELKNGYPIIKEVSADKVKNAKYIKIYKTYENELISKQLLSSSSSGLLKYVKPNKTRKIRFSTDALGRMLQGSEGEIIEEKNSFVSGINTTLNKDIERIVFEAAKSIKSGCAVVMDVKSSSILACITKPDSSFVNKSFEQYCPGSVFKIVVALCALENNIDFYYTCNGKTNVGDTVFACQNDNAHSFQGLDAALANSCNCYFVNLALQLGSEKLLDTAKKLGFDSNFELYNDWIVYKSKLPDINVLSSYGQLALLGFGQGKLTVSPLHMCNSLCTIGNGGMQNQIRIVKSVQYGENTKNIEYKNERQIFDKEDCNKLISYLRYVVTNGTGKNAEDLFGKSAGKTATAQTGQYLNGRELLNTWFAGIYPYDNPKYAIVIMCEDGRSGSEDCAPVFRKIVEKLNDL